VIFKIVPKVLMDVGVLGGCREEIFFCVLMVLGFVGDDVGEDVETKDGGGRDGGTSDDVCGAVGNVEGEVFDIIEGGPDRSGRWRIPKLGGLRDDGLKDAGGDVKRAWVVPSVVRALEDL